MRELSTVLVCVLLTAAATAMQRGAKPLAPEFVAEIARLSDKVKTTGTVNVIVTLALPEPYQPETKTSDPAAVSRQRAAIARTRDSLINSLRDTKAVVYAKWDPLPQAALRVDAEALKRLGDSPLITAIKEDRPSSPQ